LENANRVSRRPCPPFKCPPLAETTLSRRADKNSLIRACISLRVQSVKILSTAIDPPAAGKSITALSNAARILGLWRTSAAHF
jgi:hypothetical protein